MLRAKPLDKYRTLILFKTGTPGGGVHQPGWHEVPVERRAYS